MNKLPALWMALIQFSLKAFLAKEKQFKAPRLPKKFQNWKQDLMSKQRQLRYCTDRAKTRAKEEIETAGAGRI